MKFEERVLQKEFQLNDTDDLIIEYIRNHREHISEITIQMIAKELFIVPNAIMRLAHKLNYQGFSELKTLLKQEQEKLQETPRLLSNSIIKTLDIMDYKKIELVVAKCCHAKEVHFIGVGESGAHCKMMVDNFKSIKKHATTYDTYREIEYRMNECSEKDVVFVVSASGANERMNDLVQVAKDKGAFIISLTHFSKNPTSQIANIPLFYWGEKYVQNGYDVGDRTGMMILLREISEVFWRNYSV